MQRKFDKHKNYEKSRRKEASGQKAKVCLPG